MRAAVATLTGSPRPTLWHRLAAGDRYIDTGEEGGLVAEQEGDRMCDVVERRKPPQRDAGRLHLEDPLLVVLGKLGSRQSGRDRVDTNAVSSPFDGEGLGQPEERVLGHDIVG